MNPLSDPEDLHEATRVINSYAQSDWCGIAFSRHARERMAERFIPGDVITSALKSGTVVDVRTEVTQAGRRIYKYEVEMRDQYGRVTVVTAVPGRLKLLVVTAYTDIPD
ncbi:hypothetical protein N799_09945 [Lysobacter arseniciresistens ZS79]|uniref:DUF4258 domain-containing protein n=1 Tax=Lysobacter arseniciresistens ZS79 TaxID=913325 RepID=A0A0A0EYH8_9GAMM|nr:DUF4258 domain-containing protein [Lysobacter arseniciresistens]KGM54192.1 hypothetical protein N799_09945 [Lysobacter arseniciresistens ZS79]